MHKCKNTDFGMDFFLKEEKVAIYHFPEEKRYSIGLRGAEALQDIYYCPWCGVKLEK